MYNINQGQWMSSLVPLFALHPPRDWKSPALSPPERWCIDKKQFCQINVPGILHHLRANKIRAREITCFYPGCRSHLSEPVLSMLEGGEAQYWALCLMQGEQACVVSHTLAQ